MKVLSLHVKKGLVNNTSYMFKILCHCASTLVCTCMYVNMHQYVDFFYFMQVERKDTLISFMFHLMGNTLSLLELMAILFFSQAK